MSVRPDSGGRSGRMKPLLWLVTAAIMSWLALSGAGARARKRGSGCWPRWWRSA
jgi:hypothetical protein